MHTKVCGLILITLLYAHPYHAPGPQIVWGRREGETHAKSGRGGKKEIEGIAPDRLGTWNRLASPPRDPSYFLTLKSCYL